MSSIVLSDEISCCRHGCTGKPTGLRKALSLVVRSYTSQNVSILLMNRSNRYSKITLHQYFSYAEINKPINAFESHFKGVKVVMTRFSHCVAVCVLRVVHKNSSFGSKYAEGEMKTKQKKSF